MRISSCCGARLCFGFVELLVSIDIAGISCGNLLETGPKQFVYGMNGIDDATERDATHLSVRSDPPITLYMILAARSVFGLPSQPAIPGPKVEAVLAAEVLPDLFDEPMIDLRFSTIEPLPLSDRAGDG